MLTSFACNRLPIVWPKNQGDKPPPVRTQARSATILPSFVGLRFEVHNGKEYNHIQITEDMVGHKLGEFSPWVSVPMKSASPFGGLHDRQVGRHQSTLR